ncbi:adenosylcobinamide-GDP ribazoletransferase [Xylanibacter oryzae]|uniref:adenosylcobinamide-GDP ribazoletransferase n=1 Tax=Xylanibacter oryzae TaxID=185293 RepID=UPI0004AF0326|nr:adenosylcobinamide-GDP ribazoletransferase [Xylanibacter oryzae]
MQISLNTSKWYDNIWAALIFFTRLPFWRLHQPPKDCFKTVVEHWPLVGWLTGGIMAAVLYFSSMIFPYPIAVLLAISVRLLITGALHEDGLTDFFDGFGGGGNNRQCILDIMKDSRIGTYGVVGIIMYGLLLFFSLSSMPVRLASFVIIAADPFSKMVAGQIIMMMPYARTEEEAKAKVVYRNINIKAGISLAVQGLLPLALLFYLEPALMLVNWQWIIFVPCLVMYFLYLMIWRKLRGYTGDCCGALFLLIELSFYLTIVMLITINAKM